MSQLSFLNDQAITEEYLLLIQPDALITKQIVAMKRSFSERYRAPQALYSSSAIVLGVFHILPERRNDLLEILEDAMHETVSFPVQFNNFGGSGGTSIYIDIANAEDIYHINERIQMKGSLYFPGLLNRSTFNNQACIFIAKRLNVTQYEAARNEFRYRNYRAQWEMKQVCLLRKNTYTGSFEKVQSFKCRRTKTSVMSKVG